MPAGPPVTTRRRGGGGLAGVVATAAVALTVALPALRAEPVDGFPLSSYPMFTDDRGPVVDVATAVGVDREGEVHRLDPVAIAGSGEPVLAASTVRSAAAGGARSAAVLCAEIAGRVGARQRGDDGPLVEIVLRTERHDAAGFFGGGTEPDPVRIREHTRCEVP